MALYTFHLFAGAGGGILGDMLLGHIPVGAVEIDAYCRKVLLQRQRDGYLPAFPIWDDVRTMRLDNPDTKPFMHHLQQRAGNLAICGGFPCQDISVAGHGAGLSGSRSGLWAEFARILGEIRPRYAFIENAPTLTVRGLDVVLADLAALGMDARWCCLGADDIGAPHIRKRLWILADAHSQRCQEQWRAVTAYEGEGGQEPQRDSRTSSLGSVPVLRGFLVHAAPAACFRVSVPTDGRMGNQPLSTIGKLESSVGRMADGLAPRLGSPWAVEPPDVPRVAHGLPGRVARLRALGNGQIPLQAALAWNLLMTSS